MKEVNWTELIFDFILVASFTAYMFGWLRNESEKQEQKAVMHKNPDGSYNIEHR